MYDEIVFILSLFSTASIQSFISLHDLYVAQTYYLNLNLNDKNLEVVKQAKLLGVMISNDLKWDKNSEYLGKKANLRME